MSQSAGFGTRKQRGASLPLFPAAYAGNKNLVTSTILDGSGTTL